MGAVSYRARGLIAGLGAVLIGLSACAQQTEATPGVGSLVVSGAALGAPGATPDTLATVIALQQAATAVPTATLPPAREEAGVAAAAAASPTPTFVLLPTNTPRHTPLPTNTPRAALTPTAADVSAVFPSPTPRLGAPREIVDHYVFGRPFPRDPNNRIQDFAARSYPYGSTNYGGLATHHGIDIQNPLGTEVYAVGGGTVFYAGTDKSVQFGPQTDFYGNLVVIEHDFRLADGRPVFTLYGHLSNVAVETGERVEEQDRIGWVGATGVALGSHLHLEVRIGDPYDYGNTYNPELWLRPWPDYGTIAGRIVDEHGQRVYEATITFQMKNRAGPVRDTFSYADDTVNPDPILGEHYVRGDLPAGEYDVVVKIGGLIRYKGSATVEPGKTTWHDIQIK